MAVYNLIDWRHQKNGWSSSSNCGGNRKAFLSRRRASGQAGGQAGVQGKTMFSRVRRWLRREPAGDTEREKINGQSPGPTFEETLAQLRAFSRDAALAPRIFDSAVRDVLTPYHRSVFWGDRLISLDKSAGFLSDPRFAAAMTQVSSDTGITQYDAPDGISWRLNTLVWAAREALQVPGDFIECGVYQGDMSWVVTELVDLAAAGKSFYLYDTFEGFAAKYTTKEDFPGAPEFLDFADRAYKIPHLFETVCERFSSKPYVKVIKGIVPDILDEIAPSAIAFRHLDLNSAAPEIGALERLIDRVTPGGVVIFDDYGWALHRNQKKAEDDFMRERGYGILELPTGQGMFVKRGFTAESR
jgi:O-methyltransferase